MTVNRRELLRAAAVTTGALAGCQTPLHQRQGASGRQLPSDLDVLHIQSGDEHVVPAETADTPQLIQWEADGMLTIESGGEITVKETSTV